MFFVCVFRLPRKNDQYIHIYIYVYLYILNVKNIYIYTCVFFFKNKDITIYIERGMWCVVCLELCDVRRVWYKDKEVKKG